MGGALERRDKLTATFAVVEVDGRGVGRGDGDEVGADVGLRE